MTQRKMIQIVILVALLTFASNAFFNALDDGRFLKTTGAGLGVLALVALSVQLYRNHR